MYGGFGWMLSQPRPGIAYEWATKNARFAHVKASNILPAAGIMSRGKIKRAMGLS